MFRSVSIENPIINSPSEASSRHFYFTEECITSKILNSRRKSEYFIPDLPSKKKGKLFETRWKVDRIKDNKLIIKIKDRELFFLQIKALKILIYNSEVCSKHNERLVVNQLIEENETTNSHMFRIAWKMAAGSRKMDVMAINNHRGFGRWGFIDIRCHWNAKKSIRKFLDK
jgi:hypothetical protein